MEWVEIGLRVIQCDNVVLFYLFVAYPSAPINHKKQKNIDPSTWVSYLGVVVRYALTSSEEWFREFLWSCKRQPVFHVHVAVLYASTGLFAEDAW